MNTRPFGIQDFSETKQLSVKDGIPDVWMRSQLGQARGEKGVPLERVFILGKNRSLNVADGLRLVWQSPQAYIRPLVADNLAIVSTDALDFITFQIPPTPPILGAGANVILIQGLDANRERIEEQVPLQGTTTVFTQQQFLRVNLSVVVSSGTSNVNQGDISIAQVGTGNHICFIAAGEGIHHCSKFSIASTEIAIGRVMDIRAGRTTGANQQPIVDLKLINSQVRFNNTDLNILEFFHDCTVTGNYGRVEVFTLQASASGEMELHAQTDKDETFVECTMTGLRCDPGFVQAPV